MSRSVGRRAMMVPVALAMGLLMSPAMAPAAPGSQSFGIWSNPGGSVHIRVHPCGRSMCGRVIWANAKAMEDARKGGTDTLVGAELFQGFVRESDTVWRGKVFVPDIGKTFSGTVTVIDARTLQGTGCLLGRIGCKSQTWTRIDRPGG
ncbi:DUF2147 domain-containing protein [Sphingobium aquiterrae]|uniref:DUF2147 domain-containing protein n=1 Tax=Sphingobium aquiterrae TaxID=2038656 RepID=UPI00301A85B8